MRKRKGKKRRPKRFSYRQQQQQLPKLPKLPNDAPKRRKNMSAKRRLESVSSNVFFPQKPLPTRLHRHLKHSPYKKEHRIEPVEDFSIAALLRNARTEEARGSALQEYQRGLSINVPTTVAAILANSPERKKSNMQWQRKQLKEIQKMQNKQKAIWRQAKAADGTPYYWNPVTRETKWTLEAHERPPKEKRGAHRVKLPKPKPAPAHSKARLSPLSRKPLSPVGVGAFSRDLSPLKMAAPKLNAKLTSPLMAKPRFGQQFGARKMDDYETDLLHNGDEDEDMARKGSFLYRHALMQDAMDDVRALKAEREIERQKAEEEKKRKMEADRLAREHARLKKRAANVVTFILREAEQKCCALQKAEEERLAKERRWHAKQLAIARKREAEEHRRHEEENRIKEEEYAAHRRAVEEEKARVLASVRHVCIGDYESRNGDQIQKFIAGDLIDLVPSNEEMLLARQVFNTSDPSWWRVPATCVQAATRYKLMQEFTPETPEGEVISKDDLLDCIAAPDSPEFILAIKVLYARAARKSQQPQWTRVPLLHTRLVFNDADKDAESEIEFHTRWAQHQRQLMQHQRELERIAREKAQTEQRYARCFCTRGFSSGPLVSLHVGDLLDVRALEGEDEVLEARQAYVTNATWNRIPKSHVEPAVRYAVIRAHAPQHDHDLCVSVDEVVDTRPLLNHPDWVDAISAHGDNESVWGHVPLSRLEKTTRWVVIESYSPENTDEELAIVEGDLVDVRPSSVDEKGLLLACKGADAPIEGGHRPAKWGRVDPKRLKPFEGLAMKLIMEIEKLRELATHSRRDSLEKLFAMPTSALSPEPLTAHGRSINGEAIQEVLRLRKLRRDVLHSCKSSYVQRVKDRMGAAIRPVLLLSQLPQAAGEVQRFIALQTDPEVIAAERRAFAKANHMRMILSGVAQAMQNFSHHVNNWFKLTMAVTRVQATIRGYLDRCKEHLSRRRRLKRVIKKLRIFTNHTHALKRAIMRQKSRPALHKQKITHADTGPVHNAIATTSSSKELLDKLKALDVGGDTGPSANAPDKRYGLSPLVMAIVVGNLDLVQRLLQAGAKVSVDNGACPATFGVTTALEVKTHSHYYYSRDQVSTYHHVGHEVQGGEGKFLVLSPAMVAVIMGEFEILKAIITHCESKNLPLPSAMDDILAKTFGFNLAYIRDHLSSSMPTAEATKKASAVSWHMQRVARLFYTGAKVTQADLERKCFAVDSGFGIVRERFGRDFAAVLQQLLFWKFSKFKGCRRPAGGRGKGSQSNQVAVEQSMVDKYLFEEWSKWRLPFRLMWALKHSKMLVPSQVDNISVDDAIALAKSLVSDDKPSGQRLSESTAVTMMFDGVEKGSLALVLNAVVVFGCDVDTVQNDTTALIQASLSDEETAPKIVETLIKLKADVNLKGDGGHGALVHAAYHKKYKAVEALIAFAGDRLDVEVPAISGATPFYLATQEGNLDVVKAFLKEGGLPADVRLKLINQPAGDDTKFSPIYTATFYGHAEIVQLLLDNGAQVNPDDHTSTLEVAIYNHRIKCLDILLDGNVDPNMSSDDTHILNLAVVQGNLAVVERLLKAGAWIRHHVNVPAAKKKIKNTSTNGNKVVDVVANASKDTNLSANGNEDTDVSADQQKKTDLYEAVNKDTGATAISKDKSSSDDTTVDNTREATSIDDNTSEATTNHTTENNVTEEPKKDTKIALDVKGDVDGTPNQQQERGPTADQQQETGATADQQQDKDATIAKDSDADDKGDRDEDKANNDKTTEVGREFVSATATAAFLGEFAILRALMRQLDKDEREWRMKIASRAVAIHDFEASNEDEMSVAKDELVDVIKIDGEDEKDWVDAKTVFGGPGNGHVPRNHIQLTQRYVAIHDFDPTDEHDLQLKEGDLIDARELPGDDKWLDANLVFGDKVAWGHVPKNHVQKTERMVATRSCSARGRPDALSIRMDQVLDVRKDNATTIYLEAAPVISDKLKWGKVHVAHVEPYQQWLKRTLKTKALHAVQDADEDVAVLRRYHQLSLKQALQIEAEIVLKNAIGADKLTDENIALAATGLFDLFATADASNSKLVLHPKDLKRLLDEGMGLRDKFGDKFSDFCGMMYHRADADNLHFIGIERFIPIYKHLLFVQNLNPMSIAYQPE